MEGIRLGYYYMDYFFLEKTFIKIKLLLRFSLKYPSSRLSTVILVLLSGFLSKIFSALMAEMCLYLSFYFIIVSHFGQSVFRLDSFIHVISYSTFLSNIICYSLIYTLFFNLTSGSINIILFGNNIFFKFLIQ